MSIGVLEVGEWSDLEFGRAALGDARRVNRLREVAASLARNPSGTLPVALPGWTDLKAGYRLLECEGVTHQRVITPHVQRVRDACKNAGDYLLIEDTTELDYTKRAMKGAGRIGNDSGQGFLAHSTLAFQIQGWDERGIPRVSMLGLFNQKCWAREGEAITRKESKSDRLKRARESERWAEIFNVTGGPPQGAHWIYAADREGDIFEAFERCQDKGVDFVIRASRPRALAEHAGAVFSSVEKTPLLGSFNLELRARPGIAARTAKMEVRSLNVTLRPPWRPGKKLEPVSVNVVDVREVEAPRGIEPIRWTLLTSLPCATLEQAMRVVGIYSRRWLIVILEIKQGKPKGGWTWRGLLVAIARLGGFLARKGDGDPGWITLWRGWQQLMTLVQGFNLARGAEKCVQ